jgi:hypothetical protein
MNYHIIIISADAEKIGNVILADLTIAFIMTLVSAISSSKNSILVMTLTAKQQLYERYTGRLSNSLSKALKIFGWMTW